MAESGTFDPETIANRQRIADQLLLQSAKPRDIRSKLQGLGQMGETAIYGFMSGQDEKERKEGTAAQASAIAALLSGAGASAAPAAAAMPAAPPTTSASMSPTTLVGNNPSIPAAPVQMASLSPEPGIVAPPRAPVQSSAKVIGDDEGVRLGLYDPPKSPGMAPPSPVANVAAALGPAAGAPAQGAPPPAPVQVAQNAPTGLPAAPDNKAAIAKMLHDPNPYVRKLGIQLGQAAVARQLGQQPEYGKLNDESLFDKHSGKVVTAGPGFKALVDPTERASHGIPVTDNRPYQVGPGNKLINPPAETRLTVDQRGESAFEQAAGKHQAERFDKIVSDGASAKQMIGDMNALKDIGSRITTGKTAQITEALGPYAEALGLKIDGLGDLQAYEAITSKLAPQMRVPGTGATSDFEMRTFLKALPGLGKTPEGNEIIGKTFEAIQAQKQAASEIAGNALTGKMSRVEAEKALRDLPDPLALWKEQKGKMPTARPSAPTASDGWQDIGGGVRIREKR